MGRKSAVCKSSGQPAAHPPRHHERTHARPGRGRGRRGEPRLTERMNVRRLFTQENYLSAILPFCRRGNCGFRSFKPFLAHSSSTELQKMSLSEYVTGLPRLRRGVDGRRFSSNFPLLCDNRRRRRRRMDDNGTFTTRQFAATDLTPPPPPLLFRPIASPAPARLPARSPFFRCCLPPKSGTAEFTVERFLLLQEMRPNRQISEYILIDDSLTLPSPRRC